MIFNSREKKSILSLAFISIVELLQASNISIASRLWLAVKHIESCFELPVTGFKSLKSILLAAPPTSTKTKSRLLLSKLLFLAVQNKESLVN